MKLFDVYSLFDITPVRGKACTIWDDKGTQYLDLYGGHAVISIGHAHPKYIEAITDQVQKIGFYSNSVINPLQEQLAQKICTLSGLEDYKFFPCNSGAEANENALKLASFTTGKDGVIAFKKSFHGRTSGAVAITDNPSIVSPFNANHKVYFAELNNIDSVAQIADQHSISAVIIEGIQGCGGINIPTNEFLQQLRQLCTDRQIILILDEVQAGCGRTGRYYAHQHSGIKPDIITMAKGIGNGFPIGACLIAPQFKAVKGMLGTTFGGNYLAMASAIAVANVIEEEKLIDNARTVGEYLLNNLPRSPKIKDIRGRGLMIGIEFYEPMKAIRERLLYEKHIFTGSAGTNMIRLLPPLCLTMEEAKHFLEEFNEIL